MSADRSRPPRGGAEPRREPTAAGREREVEPARRSAAPEAVTGAGIGSDPEPPSGIERSNVVPAASEPTVQVMSTEYVVLTQLLNGSYSVTNYRTSLLLGVVSASGVALALVAEATRFGDTFVIFALVLLPVVLFIGIATFVRLAQSLHEAVLYTQGMNRIHHLFQEQAPSSVPYFVLSSHDDPAGLFESFARQSPRLLAFSLTTANGVVALVNSVVAAVIAAVLAIKLGGVGSPAPVVAAACVFLLALVTFMGLWLRSLSRFRRNLTVRFPTQGARAQSESGYR